MKRLLATVALAITPAIAAGQNLLTNPGFQTGDLSGWSLYVGSCASGAVINGTLEVSTMEGPCLITLRQTFGPFARTGIAGGSLGFDYAITGGVLIGGFDPGWLMLSAGGQWGGCESYASSGHVVQPCDGKVFADGPLTFTLSATLPASSTFYVDNTFFRAQYDDGTPVTLATVTPEPTPLVLLSTGLVALVGVKRRRAN